MALHRFQKGELGHWLRTVADNAQPGAAQAEIPADIAQALQTLRCIEADDDGRWRITDKACWPCAWKARRHPSALRRRIGAGRSIPRILRMFSRKDAMLRPLCARLRDMRESPEMESAISRSVAVSPRARRR